MNNPFVCNYLTAAMLILALGACTSQADIEPCDCPEFMTPSKWRFDFEPPITGPDITYHQPSYNPANPAELVYRRQSWAELSQRPQNPAFVGLWTGTLSGGPQRPLQLGYSLLVDPNYGPNGWIAFNQAAQVWKVKANGDSLQRLTGGTSTHYRPVWSPDGSRLVCRRDNDAPGGPIYIMDKQGRPLRSLLINYSGFPLAWSPDGNSLLLDYAPNGNNNELGLATYNLLTDKLEFLVLSPHTANTSGEIRGAAWHPDGKSVVWCGSLGLYRTDLSSRRTVRLRSACTGRLYFSPSIAPDGRQIAVERYDRRDSDDGFSEHTEINIWTLNIDGSNERRVDF